LHILENHNFNMHLNIFLEMKIQESTCPIYAKYGYKYTKVGLQLETLYFQVDRSLICINVVPIFHVIVIIYHIFVKVFWNS
jgi:hypothetical protein